MRLTTTALGGALINVAIAVAPANAQQGYGAQPPSAQPATNQSRQAQPAEQPQQAQNGSTGIQTHTPKISRGATKAILALQNAVKENNTAAIPAALAAAQAAAKTGDDRYAVGMLQLQAAGIAKDNAGIAAGIEAMLASGSVTEDEKFSLYYYLGSAYASANQDDRAAQAFSQALQLNPNNVDAIGQLAELRLAQGQTKEALTLFQKGIELQSAAGARPSETWYKRAVAVAYNAKLPQAFEVSRDWVKAYPTPASWNDAIAIYQNLVELDESQTLDLLRLKRTSGTLSENNYLAYGALALKAGLSGEAKAVLEEGFAANAIKRSDPDVSQAYELASEKTKGDRESLPAAPVAGANARQTMSVGDAYYGYGEYAKAAEFYRAALGKQGADANLINLHLGMALARQGDKAGAQAALSAVGGPYAEIAKFWQIYASTRA